MFDLTCLTFNSQMDDIDAMFSDLLGEMDHLSQVSCNAVSVVMFTIFYHHSLACYLLTFANYEYF